MIKCTNLPPTERHRVTEVLGGGGACRTGCRTMHGEVARRESALHQDRKMDGAEVLGGDRQGFDQTTVFHGQQPVAQERRTLSNVSADLGDEPGHAGALQQR